MGLGCFFFVIMGAICSAIASSKGRNAFGWFFAGLLGIVGIVIIAVLPNLKVEEARRQAQEIENRRLREQLRQEKIKSQTFQTHATRRLDAHDQHLGIDTRPELGAGAGAPVAQLDAPGKEPINDLAQAAATSPAAAPAPAAWYYEKDGQSLGPLPASDLLRLLETGGITGDTLLWSATCSQWTAARHLPQFSPFIPT